MLTFNLYFQDRTSTSRLLDLEAQLSQARAEIARIKREKDEVSAMTVLFLTSRLNTYVELTEV